MTQKSFSPSSDFVGKDQAFMDRMHDSTHDFWHGVRPLVEKQFKGTILPLETLPNNQVVKAFDHVGIDAFYIDRQGNLKGLASRMNYTRFSKQPAFSLRYALWNKSKKNWTYNCEYQRKLDAVKNPQSFNFFPELHIESFGQQKRKGLIAWSYVARTADIVRYIEENFGDKSKVATFEPKIGERREVVFVPIDQFAKNHDLHAVKIIAG